MIIGNINFSTLNTDNSSLNVRYVNTNKNHLMSATNLGAEAGDPITTCINAVEIDWNGAKVKDGVIINTTSDLLKWIKSSQPEVKHIYLPDILYDGLYDSSNSSMRTMTPIYDGLVYDLTDNTDVYSGMHYLSPGKYNVHWWCTANRDRDTSTIGIYRWNSSGTPSSLKDAINNSTLLGSTMCYRIAGGDYYEVNGQIMSFNEHFSDDFTVETAGYYIFNIYKDVGYLLAKNPRLIINTF